MVTIHVRTYKVQCRSQEVLPERPAKCEGVFWTPAKNAKFCPSCRPAVKQTLREIRKEPK